ncbi:hypothetical protein ACFYPH_20305 [Micromonospora sp. NPDC005252]|uniref:hypothetical protein n=1 Tax=Micromonospora sp. NPDC005252 TaxID=3364228 RepID=UPI0036955A13
MAACAARLGRDAERRSPFLPTGGSWQVSEEYAADVRTSQYNGTVYLDAGTGTVYLRVTDA